MHVFTEKASIRTPGNASSYATGSYTPVAGEVIFVATMGGVGSGSPNTPTCSGNGITWSLVQNVLFDSNRGRLCLFVGYSASASAGAVTISWGGQSQRFGNVVVFSVSKVLINDPIIQSNSGASHASGLIVSLSAAQKSYNGVIGVFGGASGGSSLFNAGSGFTILTQGFTEDYNMMIEYNVNMDTSVDATFVSGSDPIAGIAVELEHIFARSYAVVIG